VYPVTVTEMPAATLKLANTAVGDPPNVTTSAPITPFSVAVPDNEAVVVLSYVLLLALSPVIVKTFGDITKVKPLLAHGPPPELLSVMFNINPYDPAGVALVVVTVKMIVAPFVPLGVNEGVVVPPFVTVSVPEVKAHVTPAGVPAAQVN
jgi:hypothetical protein